MQQPDVLDMVQVQGHVHSSRTSNLLKRRCERPQRPTVEFHRVLADLQDRRRSSGLCPSRDCLRMLKRDDVEGGDSEGAFAAASRGSCVLTKVMWQPLDQLSRKFGAAVGSFGKRAACFHVDAAIHKTLGVQMGWTKVFEDLAGQVAVITGGARGLGLTMAQALARWGTKIALLDVLAEVKDSAETVQHEFAVESVGVAADVTDDSSVTAAFGEVSHTLGSPSILINAAGITVWEDSIDVSKESWQRVIDINLTGTFLCCQALARACTAADTEGVIVNVSSMSARVVNLPQHQASYHASKAGVEMLTKALAVEWAPIGIRVNAIAPGYMLSEMTRQFTTANLELAERWRNMIPAGRMGEPADLEALVVFLCSARSSYLMGQSIVIDGAYTAV